MRSANSGGAARIKEGRLPFLVLANIGAGLQAESSSQIPAMVVEDLVGELPTTTSAIPVVASVVQVAPSSVPHPSSMRRAIIMMNRRKECVPREKGPLKRFAETRDSHLCPPSKRTAPSGENFFLLLPYL
jgi:hypothetical protein